MKTYYDVHIHSCLSPCAENSMTPNNIVNMAVLKELDIIAITDHNSIRNVRAAIKAAENLNIKVVPGMEVQTIEEVHMLCLFKNIESAEAFALVINDNLIIRENVKEKFGEQIIMNSNDEIIDYEKNLLLTSVNITIDELIMLVNRYDGVIIPAHVDRDYASIISTIGFIPNDYNFKYIEVSQNDTSKKILTNEEYKNKYYILRNSDSHNLGSINEPLYSIELEEKSIECFINQLKGRSFMKELSLHILDIARNSIVAEAENIRIVIIEDLENDKLVIKMKDDGKGMDSDTVKQVVDPFYTTRTTRKVGLGVPMFKANAESCDGHFEINSELGCGTEIVAEFKHSHIDRVPLGDMAETIVAIINGNSDVDLLYTHEINQKKFTLSTKEIRKRLGEVDINNLEVLLWLKSYIKESLEEINKYEI